MTKSNDQPPIRGQTFRDRLPDSTEGRILEAALDCIAEQGIAATSTYAIAERAGLNQGNIHYYFRSKDDLLLRVLEPLHENSKANIDDLAHGDLPPRDERDKLGPPARIGAMRTRD